MEIRDKKDAIIVQRPGDAAAMEEGNEADTNNNASQEIPFHKHCQQTICSAYYNGDGATWGLLTELSLPGINRFLDPPAQSQVQDEEQETEYWRSYFTKSENVNITYDFCAILQLMDRIAANVNPQITLSFTDNDGMVDGVAYAGIPNTPLTYNGVTDLRIGRPVTLSIDGKDAFNFHTLYKSGNDTLDYALPKKNVTLKFNKDTIIGSFNAVGPGTDVDIDIAHRHDLCQFSMIQCENESDGTQGGGTGSSQSQDVTYLVQVNGEHGRIYTIESHDQSIILDVDLSNYVQDDDGQIIEFEVHVWNTGASNLTINDIGFNDPDGEEIAVKPLTSSNNVVAPGTVNIYKFKYHYYPIYDEVATAPDMKFVTYELASKYEDGVILTFHSLVVDESNSTCTEIEDERVSVYSMKGCYAVFPNYVLSGRFFNVGWIRSDTKPESWDSSTPKYFSKGTEGKTQSDWLLLENASYNLWGKRNTTYVESSESSLSDMP